MLAGEMYNAVDESLIKELNRGRALVFEYNRIHPLKEAERHALLKKLLGKTGENFQFIQPFYCDYGSNIEIGENFFVNFNFTVLDEAKVTIGNNVFIAPNVSIYTACHPINPAERNTMVEYALPVKIGDNVWIGGNVTIIPGITIGSNVTIGAGSVVVKDIPDNCVAVGNPCRVTKKLNADDFKLDDFWKER